MVTLPCISLAISSRVGPIILHGPHHSAQKSTTTGPPAPITSDLKLASVTLTVDMTHLSRTRTRDNTRRVTVRKVRRGRACVKPRGAACYKCASLGGEILAVEHRERGVQIRDEIAGV